MSFPSSTCTCGQPIEAKFKYCPNCRRQVKAETLCETLRRLAVDTFERLAESHRVGKPLGEETFTDLHLQDLRRAHGHRIVTTQYSRNEEADTGADWEWWFHHGGKTGFGIRVQAKKQDKDYRYLLHHKAGSSGRFQIDVLIDDAAESDCLPFYVLYNHRNGRLPQGVSPHCGHAQADQRHLGCTMASALAVRWAMAGARPHHETFKKSLPWHLLLCQAIEEPSRNATHQAFDQVDTLHHSGHSYAPVDRCYSGSPPKKETSPRRPRQR